MSECSAYVGLDVHKDAIAVVVALPGQEAPAYRGEIKPSGASLTLARQHRSGELVDEKRYPARSPRRSRRPYGSALQCVRIEHSVFVELGQQ